MSTVRSMLRTAGVAALVAAAMALTNVSAEAARRAQPQSFASPKQAADALFEAAKAKNAGAILRILGPSNRDWLRSGDSVQDMQRVERFATAYAQKSTITNAGDAKALLAIGNDDFPFAFPIVKRGEKWSFDAEAGREELLNRRIGGNELDTIQTLLAIVDAQREYASRDRDDNGAPDYAMRFRSSPGKKNGLYWPAKQNEAQSPLGPLVADAVRQGYRPRGEAPSPYHGYYFRILPGQGPHADGGAYSYVVKGRMIGGFAVIAHPAHYGVSGLKTFAVSHAGVVYETDLGPETSSLARRIKVFDPDAAWKKVDAAPK